MKRGKKLILTKVYQKNVKLGKLFHVCKSKNVIRLRIIYQRSTIIQHPRVLRPKVLSVSWVLVQTFEGVRLFRRPIQFSFTKLCCAFVVSCLLVSRYYIIKSYSSWKCSETSFSAIRCRFQSLV